MRRVARCVLLLALFGWIASAAAQHVVVIAHSFNHTSGMGDLEFELHCPAGTYVVALHRDPAFSFAETRHRLIGPNGGYLLGNDVPGPGSGYLVGVRVLPGPFGAQSARGTYYLICSVGPPIVEVKVPWILLGNEFKSARATCPAPTVPLGGYVDDVNSTAFRGLYTAFVVGGTYFDDLPRGLNGPPTAFEVGATNLLPTQQSLMLRVPCHNLPDALLVVDDAPTSAGSNFSIFQGVPDNRIYINHTAVPGINGTMNESTVWGANGIVPAEYRVAGLPVPDSIIVKGLVFQGSVPKSSARAVSAMLVAAAASTPPAPTIVAVVEFYNAALDHYFITAVPKEISDLDSGVHKGWARTGKSFNAYGTGSTGRTGRRPVCREYGNPAAGLDSHFYSASPLECVDTLVKFGTSWLLEASEVFEIDLPDEVTGACPAGDVPIYRVWNNRADSNHRYTTSVADRDAMVAKGYIKEGYGPNSVTLCALP